MNYTNLNIVTQDNTFKYIIEYFDETIIDNSSISYYETEDGLFFVNSNADNVVNKKNYWYNTDNEEITSDFIPKMYRKSSFNLYFPKHSVETYSTNMKYVLTINTWVNSKYIYLGSFLIDRSNAIACESGPKKFLNDEYYEYIHIDTIDPVYLIYSDDWKYFRVNVCGEKVVDNIQPNNTSSNLNFTLTPVKLNDNIYIKLDGYDSSQSALLLSNSINNYMSNNLSFDIQEDGPCFSCVVKYNTLYDNLREYLLETYQIDTDDYICKYVLMFKTKETLIKYVEHKFNGAMDNTVFTFDEIKFDSWQDYFSGISVSSVFVLSKDEDDIVILSSNSLMMNKEMFKYLVCNSEIKTINLDSVQMETKQFDVVNIIENQIVNVERQDDYKANIIKPIFVKVQESSTIRLHPLVNENIVLNLDSYKNKVESFVIKINNTNFYEIGRINSGIVFKIVGNMINTEETEGIYYILNEEGELVTTGKYIIV